MIILALVCGCGYSHIASTTCTFNQPTPLVASAQDGVRHGPLNLEIIRHMDTVMSGPDVEEDQLLTLEVRNFRLNQKILVPSPNIKTHFTTRRSGPEAEGRTFSGFLIVRSVGSNQVTINLHLVVNASTSDNRYAQTLKYRGDYRFYREDSPL